jgi:hypothetical protein
MTYNRHLGFCKWPFPESVSYKRAPFSKLIPPNHGFHISIGFGLLAFKFLLCLLFCWPQYAQRAALTSRTVSFHQFFELVWSCESVHWNLLIELSLKDTRGCLRALDSAMEWSRGTTIQDSWDRMLGQAKKTFPVPYDASHCRRVHGKGAIGKQMNPMSTRSNWAK